MPLTPFVGTILDTQLNANFDDKTIALAGAAIAGQKDHAKHHWLAFLNAAVTANLRSMAWVQQDDAELRDLIVYGFASAGGLLLQGQLTVDNGDARFLVDNTVIASITSTAAGYMDSRIQAVPNLDLRPITGPRMRLLKGVRYRLTLISPAAGSYTEVAVVAQMRSIRRPS